jgi:hypothetical protein
MGFGWFCLMGVFWPVALVGAACEAIGLALQHPFVVCKQREDQSR